MTGSTKGSTKRTTSAARRRDRRVYLAGHPMLFGLLCLVRRRPVQRLGSRVLVSSATAVRQVLTEVPLDRASERTTGGAIRKHEGAGALFDQSGSEHRASRRALAGRLDSRGVAELRPVWTPVLAQAAERLAAGRAVDLSELSDDIAGRTTAALLGLDLAPEECRALARASRRTASSAAADELPSLRGSLRGILRPTAYRDHLAETFGGRVDPLGKMLALAAVTTTYATLPRAVAWVADDDLWADAADPARRSVLVPELLRVLAPTPLLPRVPAAPAEVVGCPVTPDDQLLLVVRHAVDAHRRDPSVQEPASAALSQLVFGAGGHACPGAGLARAQLDDVLATLAPYFPRVVAARPDRYAALPAWRSLVVR